MIAATICRERSCLGFLPVVSDGPVQIGFWEEHGLQCGYCTPGMIMTTAALLCEQPDPSEAEIREAIEGNVCRCTGYQQIVNAVQHAARLAREGR